MKHEFYAVKGSAPRDTYRIMSDFSAVNHGDIVEIAFPNKTTKILLVSIAADGGGCDGCALDVLEDYCEVVNIDGAPLCMACAGTKTIFRNMDSIMEDL